MFMTQIRRALVGIAMLVALGAFTPAHGATLTFTDNNCSSFSVTGAAPNFTLVCASLPCSIAASPSANPTPGTAVALTANCTPVATGTTWSLAGGPATCPLTSSTSNPATIGAPGVEVSGCVYQVQASSGALSGSTNITVSWTTAALPTPTGCSPSVTTTPASLTNTGGLANLNVTGCSVSSGGPLTYAWSRAGVANWSTAQSAVDTLAANAGASGQTTSYQVKVCNGASCTSLLPASPLTATVPGTGGGGGAGGGISCAAFTNTFVLDLKYAVNTQDRQEMRAAFGNGDIVVARFTTPASFGINANGNAGFLNVVELLERAVHTIALSTEACDLTTAKVMKSNVSFSPNISFYTNTSTALQPSTTYYLNIVNTNGYMNIIPPAIGSVPSNATCGSPIGDCGIAVTLKAAR